MVAARPSAGIASRWTGEMRPQIRSDHRKMNAAGTFAVFQDTYHSLDDVNPLYTISIQGGCAEL
jgi:hypothetical protein